MTDDLEAQSRRAILGHALSLPDDPTDETLAPVAVAAMVVAAGLLSVLDADTRARCNALAAALLTEFSLRLRNRLLPGEAS